MSILISGMLPITSNAARIFIHSIFDGLCFDSSLRSSKYSCRPIQVVDAVFGFTAVVKPSVHSNFGSFDFISANAASSIAELMHAQRGKRVRYSFVHSLGSNSALHVYEYNYCSHIVLTQYSKPQMRFAYFTKACARIYEAPPSDSVRIGLVSNTRTRAGALKRPRAVSHILTSQFGVGFSYMIPVHLHVHLGQLHRTSQIVWR